MYLQYFSNILSVNCPIYTNRDGKFPAVKEELKSKLYQLQGLLTKYMTSDVTEGNVTAGGDEVCEIAEEATDLHDEQKEAPNVSSPSTKISPAGQIMSLLTEIGSNEMLQPKYDEKFQPWFWEPSSGRLMTV